MSQNKYISTKNVVRLTGLLTQEFYDLIHSGKLPAHKAPKSGWRISPQDLVALDLMKEEADYPAIGKEQTAKGGVLYDGRMFSRWL